MSLAIADIKGKLDYLWWATTNMLADDTICPACSSNNAQFVHRKYVVTSLYECQNCHIRFRVPKETARRAKKLYTKEVYSQGFTTDLPSPTELAALLESNFAGNEKHFGPYITVLKSILPSGAKVLDFGSSWGYGSWQIKQAGFDVYSYEVGEQRARYAEEHLDCKMVTDLSTIYGTIDCVFSSHVIEHLPDPGILLREAQKLLVPDGYFVCFCPNGNPALETEQYYHYIWGKVHPLLITPGFMTWAIEKSRLSLCEMRAGKNLMGGELLTIARKARQPLQP
jgi:2-polyprenyl-3-methyl-5-hydroxy-6-metoxy-1,4-benzoquinol methylase